MAARFAPLARILFACSALSMLVAGAGAAAGVLFPSVLMIVFLSCK
jgi:hypothetical protein